MPTQRTTAVLEVAGAHWATEKALTEETLGQRPGVLAVQADPDAQTAVVTYDPAQTSTAELAARVRACGRRCTGRSVAATGPRAPHRPGPSTPTRSATSCRRPHGGVGSLPGRDPPPESTWR